MAQPETKMTESQIQEFQAYLADPTILLNSRKDARRREAKILIGQATQYRLNQEAKGTPLPIQTKYAQTIDFDIQQVFALRLEEQYAQESNIVEWNRIMLDLLYMRDMLCIKCRQASISSMTDLQTNYPVIFNLMVDLHIALDNAFSTKVTGDSELDATKKEWAIIFANAQKQRKSATTTPKVAATQKYVDELKANQHKIDNMKRILKNQQNNSAPLNTLKADNDRRAAILKKVSKHFRVNPYTEDHPKYQSWTNQEAKRRSKLMEREEGNKWTLRFAMLTILTMAGLATIYFQADLSVLASQLYEALRDLEKFTS